MKESLLGRTLKRIKFFGVAAAMAVCVIAVNKNTLGVEAAFEAQHYDIREDGGSWDGTYYTLNNEVIKDAFFCDGTYTYFLQSDGSPMKDRLTYHPDGEHIIYFDSNGHEVFSDFANVKKSISGEAVDDLCFFDVYGYMYTNVLTYNQDGTEIYYANPYGVMECDGWFQFAADAGGVADALGATEGKWGYAHSDGHIDLQSIGDIEHISAVYGTSNYLTIDDNRTIIVTGIDINLASEHNYYRYETTEQAIEADTIAKYYADEIMKDTTLTTDLERVQMAATIVAYHSSHCIYDMDAENHYQSPYGVFVAGVYTCSGSTRALGRILDYMGIKWTHINEGQYSHQWCELYMDGQIGIADGMGGVAGYGSSDDVYAQNGIIIF